MSTINETLNYDGSEGDIKFMPTFIILRDNPKLNINTGLKLEHIMLLSRFIYSYKYFKDNDRLSNDGYFYMFSRYITTDLGFKIETIRRYVDYLERLGYLTKKINYNEGNKIYYKLHIDFIRDKILEGNRVRNEKLRRLKEDHLNEVGLINNNIDSSAEYERDILI